MSTLPDSNIRARFPGTAFVVTLLSLACGDAGSAESVPDATTAPAATTSPAPSTRILVELPPGIDVAINGRPRGTTPLPAFDAEPGLYTVTLTTACTKTEVPLEVKAHETSKLDRDRAKDLQLATLEVSAHDLAGRPLEHTVTLGERVLGGGKGTSTTEVPPCTARVKVASEGLGGFIEDVDFGKEAVVKRAVVLSPGPDLVRIHGGPFTPGTGGARMLEDDFGCFPRPHYKVNVESFDIDRTEVTVEQWKACWDAGECAKNDPKSWVTVLPDDWTYPKCHIEVLGGEAPIRPGREQLPMNCIAQWQAEGYCRWAGKRLLTDIEWEYAARSGRSEYTFPWGNDYSPCVNKDDRDPNSACRLEDGTVRPPCSYPAMNTTQGVCDMANNLYEMVTYQDFPGRKKIDEFPYEGPWTEPEHKQYVIGDSGEGVGACMLVIDGRWGKWAQQPVTGFRCARDID